jgi:hypothetical protein
MEIIDLSQEDDIKISTAKVEDGNDVVVVAEINSTPKSKNSFTTNKRKESPEANKENLLVENCKRMQLKSY